MATSNGGPNSEAVEGEEPSPAARMELERTLRRLGEALNERTDQVVDGIRRRNDESGVVLEPIVEESFVKVGTVSTIAVARWMAGESPEVAREVGQESWNIFGQLAAPRAGAPTRSLRAARRSLPSWRLTTRSPACPTAH